MADQKAPEEVQGEAAPERKRKEGLGTHTLGKEFGLSGNPPISEDPEYRARKKAKDIRTAQHKRERGSGTGLGSSKKEKA